MLISQQDKKGYREDFVMDGILPTLPPDLHPRTTISSLADTDLRVVEAAWRLLEAIEADSRRNHGCHYSRAGKDAIGVDRTVKSGSGALLDAKEDIEAALYPDQQSPASPFRPRTACHFAVLGQVTADTKNCGNNSRFLSSVFTPSSSGI
jgi:hypothetical protein